MGNVSSATKKMDDFKLIEKKPKTIHVNSLPSALLEKIFSFLWMGERQRYHLVCSNWRFKTGVDNEELDLRFGDLIIENVEAPMHFLLTDTQLSGLITVQLKNSAKKLRSINLSHHWEITSISLTTLVKNCPSLKAIFLSFTMIDSLKGIEKLSLTQLTLKTCPIRTRDLECLKSMPLRHLNISCTEVHDLNPLQSLTSLTYLDFSHNQVRDIAFLQALPALTYLNMSNQKKEFWDPVTRPPHAFNDTGLENIDSVRFLSSLTYLNISCNRITSLEPLAKLPYLAHLNCMCNRITSLEPLRDLPLITVNPMCNPLERAEGLPEAAIPDSPMLCPFNIRPLDISRSLDIYYM